jgi:hypothetical protein
MTNPCRSVFDCFALDATVGVLVFSGGPGVGDSGEAGVRDFLLPCWRFFSVANWLVRIGEPAALRAAVSVGKFQRF